jgi:glycosyltransferase involved in cell wall biosynthesis
MSKRILACGEFSQLSTGYAVYMRGLLNFLHNNGYQVLELACACVEGDPRLAQVPWMVIPNIPHESNKKAKEKYDSFPSAEFGAWQFEDILVNFKPDVVFDIRDNWHYEYQLRSPLRNYFASVIMPAIDAYPQNKSWLGFHSKADAVLSYTKWGIGLMNDSGHKINTVGATPPIASNEYIPLDKRAIKKEFGFEDKIVIGMVGRNQKRKLFPDLFSSFSAFLNKT